MKKRVLCYIGKTVSQKGVCEGNSGNYLFNLALESYIVHENADVSFYSLRDFETHTADFVNNNFDIVLYSTANIINPRTKCVKFFTKAKEIISQYKIPIFFIGAGLETKIYDTELKFLNPIKDELSRFFEAVAKCGGAFSLRGYRTAQVFKKLGFDNYYTTGCPSLFMFGKNLQINPKPLKKEELKPIINGTMCLKNNKINRFFKDYPESIFVCQDKFLRILEERKNYPIRYSDLSLKLRFGSSVTSLLKENRIKLFKDIPVWIDYFKNNGYNFAFGARIHGNIIALLAGIPVCLYTDDMRVLEMAEFFDIPYITKLGKGFDLYDAYNMIDYSKFNFTFESKLNNFQRFFDKYGIPCKIGQGIEHLTK